MNPQRRPRAAAEPARLVDAREGAAALLREYQRRTEGAGVGVTAWPRLAARLDEPAPAPRLLRSLAALGGGLAAAALGLWLVARPGHAESEAIGAAAAATSKGGGTAGRLGAGGAGGPRACRGLCRARAGSAGRRGGGSAPRGRAPRRRRPNEPHPMGRRRRGAPDRRRDGARLRVPRARRSPARLEHVETAGGAERCEGPEPGVGRSRALPGCSPSLADHVRRRTREP